MTSPVAKLIRLMVETGVAPELIEQTVEAFAEMFSSRKSMDVTVTERDESMDDRVTRIREKDRIRQRARRERERESMDSSVDVRGLSMDERDSRTATLVPQVKNLSSFSKESKILKKEKERKKEQQPWSLQEWEIWSPVPIHQMHQLLFIKSNEQTKLIQPFTHKHAHKGSSIHVDAAYGSTNR